MKIILTAQEVKQILENHVKNGDSKELIERTYEGKLKNHEIKPLLNDNEVFVKKDFVKEQLELTEEQVNTIFTLCTEGEL